MTAPSNANTSGLKVVARVYSTIGGELKAIMEQHDRFMSGEPLVTAASAQAAIDAEKARADRLAKFGQHINWELSFCYLDDEEGEPGCWAVHSVNGGRNDREWTLIGRGDTPDDAIRAALQQETQK